MLENWCWQKEVLERLSKHHETSGQLPDEMFESMIRAKHANVAFSSLRQLYLSRLDLSIHGPNPPNAAKGLQVLVDELRPKITLIENPSGNNMLRTFGHLMNQVCPALTRVAKQSVGPWLTFCLLLALQS